MVLHCHTLQHEDNGMMAQIRVRDSTTPGPAVGFGLAVGIVAMTAMFALAYYLFAWRHVGKEQASERMKNSEMSVCVPLVETGAADKVMCKFAIETNFMEQ